MNKLFLALILSFVGHTMAWFHMQAQFKWEFAKSYWWIILGGITISFAFYYSTLWYYQNSNVYKTLKHRWMGIATHLPYTLGSQGLQPGDEPLVGRGIGPRAGQGRHTAGAQLPNDRFPDSGLVADPGHVVSEPEGLLGRAGVVRRGVRSGRRGRRRTL